MDRGLARKDPRHLGVEMGPGHGGAVSRVAVVMRLAGGVRQPGPDLGEVVHEGMAGELSGLELGQPGLSQQLVGQPVLQRRAEAVGGLGADDGDQAFQGRGDELIAADGMGLARRGGDPVINLLQGHLRGQLRMAAPGRRVAPRHTLRDLLRPGRSGPAPCPIAWLRGGGR